MNCPALEALIETYQTVLKVRYSFCKELCNYCPYYFRCPAGQCTLKIINMLRGRLLELGIQERQLKRLVEVY
mgnify:CR=1 FL=1